MQEITDGSVPSVSRFPTDTQDVVRSVVDDEGRSCVEFSTDAWNRATQTDYINGIPMLFKRR